MIWLLVGYMWLFVHRPFEIWPLLAEYRIERLYMIGVLGAWLLSSHKQWQSWRSNAPALLLAVTLLVAVQLSPYATFAHIEDWFKELVFYLLIVTSVRTHQQLKILIIAYVAIITLYETHSLWEYFHGRMRYEMGTKRMIGIDNSLSHPNSFGASVLYSLPFLLPVWIYARTNWQKLAVVACVPLAIACVVLTGSRSSMVGLAVLAAGALFASKYRMRLILAVVVAAPIVGLYLPNDLRDRYLSLIDSSRGVGFAQQSIEFRSNSFWDGIESFTANPMFGAGIGSYRAKTGLDTHNVYNEAMGELGVMGLMVLIALAWVFLTNYRDARRLRSPLWDDDDWFLYRVCLAAGLGCFMLFFLGIGAHNLMRYNWLWFAAFSSCALSLLVQRDRINTTHFQPGFS